MPMRRPMMDSDEELPSAKTNTATATLDGKLAKVFRFFSRKHHPHVAMVIRYFFFFLLGGLAGIIPYFFFLVQLCQVDMALKATYPIPSTAHAVTSGGHVVAEASQKSGGAEVIPKTQDSVNDLTTPPTTWRSTAPPRPTRVVTENRNATGTGNDDISLQCPGTIHIIRARYSTIEGDEDTVSRLNKVCQDSLTRMDKLNQCANKMSAEELARILPVSKFRPNPG